MSEAKESTIYGGSGWPLFRICVCFFSITAALQNVENKSQCMIDYAILKCFSLSNDTKTTMLSNIELLTF